MKGVLINAGVIIIGLCVIYIGISGMLKEENPLILIFSMVIGSLIGTLLDIDRRISFLGEYIGKYIKASLGSSVSVAEGFATGSLMFCAGAMAIVGSLNAGLSGDNNMLFTKSVLDLISSAMLSVGLGVGILFSSFFVITFQGAIVLLAQYLQPFLTKFAIAELLVRGPC